MPTTALKLDENIPDLLAVETLVGRLWILSDDRLRIWPAEDSSGH